ncbi:MAG: hypothetical protein ACT4NX_10295 [Deltaproteobacteria bacterium]
MTLQNRYVMRIAFFWFVVPFFAVGAAYALSMLYFKYDVAAMLSRNF